MSEVTAPGTPSRSLYPAAAVGKRPVSAIAGSSPLLQKHPKDDTLGVGSPPEGLAPKFPPIMSAAAGAA